MDKRNWKAILLEWIDECGFIERDHLNVEQTDIHEFFRNFHSKHDVLSTYTNMTITEFLKEFYPQFKLNDNNDKFNSNEYMYIYSLLLHFCCVKSPQTDFHEICQKLPESSQKIVATFFRELLVVTTINGNSLCNVIDKLEERSPNTSPPSQENESYVNSSDSTASTPLKRNFPLRLSAMLTPKSHLLEERNRELFNLRAQLETERYDKSLLEMQIKQNEETIKQLNENQKQLIQQIESLRSDILFKCNESYGDKEQSNTLNEDIQQIKARLLKEVTDKDEELIYLQDNLRTVQDQKILLENKLMHYENQVGICMVRMEDLEIKTNDLNEELEKKDNIIRCLEENQKELEQYISEMRAVIESSKKSPHELNTTAELLDSSFAHSSDASRLNSESPENLGVTVVDKHLQEKEYECKQLRNELSLLHNNNALLVKQIRQIIQTESETFQIDINTSELDGLDNIAIKSDRSHDESHDELVIQFNILENCLEKMNSMYHFEKRKADEANLEIEKAKQENNDWEQKLKNAQDKCDNLQANLNAMKLANDELNNEKEIIEKSYRGQEEDLEIMKEEYMRVLKQLEISQKENDDLRQELKQINDKCEKLQESTLMKENQMTDDIEQMKIDLKEKQANIESYKEMESNLKHQHEQILIQNEKLKELNRELDNHMRTLKENLESKDQEMLMLGTELSTLNIKNANLEKNIDTLMQSCSVDGSKDNLTEDEMTLILQKEIIQNKASLKLKESELNNVKLEMDQLQYRFKQLSTIISEHSTTPQDILDDIDSLETTLKTVLDNNALSASKLAKLEMINIENAKQIDELTMELNEKKNQTEQQMNLYEELRKLQSQLIEYECSTRSIEEKHLQIIEETKNEMNEKEKVILKQLEDYNMKCNELGEELRLERESNINKGHELVLALDECGKLKDQLAETEMNLKLVQESYDVLNENHKHCATVEGQVKKLEEDNNMLQELIDKLKKELDENVLQMGEMEKMLEMERQSLEEVKEESAVYQLKLKSEVNMKNELLDLLENEKAICEQCNNDIETYKAELNKYKEDLNNMDERFQKLSNERENLMMEINDVKSLLLHEQEQKRILLEALDESTEQLKILLEEKEEQIKKLENEKIENRELLETNNKLSNNLNECNNQLSLYVEKKQKDKNNLQNQLTCITQRQIDEDEDMSIYERVVYQVKAILENYIDSGGERDSTDLNSCDYNSEGVIGETIQGIIEDITNRDAAEVASTDAETAVCDTNVNYNNANDDADVKDYCYVHSIDDGNNPNISHLKQLLECFLMRYERFQKAEENRKANDMRRNEYEEEIAELHNEILSQQELNGSLKAELKKLENHLNEKDKKINELNERYMKNLDKFKKLEKLRKDLEKRRAIEENANKAKIETMHSEMMEYKKDLIKVQSMREKSEFEYKVLLQENKKLNDKYRQQQMKLKDSQQSLKQCKELEDKIVAANESLEQALHKNAALEERCNKHKSENIKLQKEIDTLKNQQQKQLDDNERLIQDIHELKTDKASLKNELKELKLDMQKCNENVSQLVGQIGIMNADKENLIEECQNLRIKYDEKCDYAKHCENKLLLAEEKFTKASQELMRSETSMSDLQMTIQSLRDSNDSSVKRIEKMALKLGETQAQCNKLEKDNEKLSSSSSNATAIVESLQKDKNFLQADSKCLKERLARAERCHEQLVIKVQGLEELNRSLKQKNEELEATENTLKMKLTKLEKIRETNEEKLRQLNSDLNTTENLNVKLNLEVGALNTQLKQGYDGKLKDLTDKLKVGEQQLQHLQDMNNHYKKELEKLREEKTSINDQLSASSRNLDVVNKNYDELLEQMEKLRSEILILRHGKLQIEQEYETFKETHEEKFKMNDQILQDREKEIHSLQVKLSKMEEDLEEKVKEVTAKSSQEEMDNNNDKNALEDELNNLRQRLAQTEEALEKERQKNAKLLMNTELLHSKYQNSKRNIQELANQYEERIRENRHEWEGKLEKMKEKMKTLYMEETTKIKSKCDREIATIKIEMEELKKQNHNYEEHTKKLSAKIVGLNEKILEHEKENTILTTKLKHFNEQDTMEKFKKPNSSTNAPAATSANLGTDLTMEDEEGEIFNNTYLTDLKMGRMSAFMSRDVCAEELKYRNSLLPPHLKCSYAVQFDHDIPEDDLKKSPKNKSIKGLFDVIKLRKSKTKNEEHTLTKSESRHSFDNSMIALLNNTTGGASSSSGGGIGDGGGIGGFRKKSNGLTHYKRPGPPTPSKNGTNRLSVGGCNSTTTETTSRDILKDSAHNDNHNDEPIAITKTPARFSFFSSRFSMGNPKDESTPPKRRLSNLFKRK